MKTFILSLIFTASCMAQLSPVADTTHRALDAYSIAPARAQHLGDSLISASSGLVLGAIARGETSIVTDSVHVLITGVLPSDQIHVTYCEPAATPIAADVVIDGTLTIYGESEHRVRYTIFR